jgi:hypothetical protein
MFNSMMSLVPHRKQHLPQQTLFIDAGVLSLVLSLHKQRKDEGKVQEKRK